MWRRRCAAAVCGVISPPPLPLHALCCHAAESRSLNGSRTGGDVPPDELKEGLEIGNIPRPPDDVRVPARPDWLAERPAARLVMRASASARPQHPPMLL